MMSVPEVVGYLERSTILYQQDNKGSETFRTRVNCWSILDFNSILKRNILSYGQKITFLDDLLCSWGRQAICNEGYNLRGSTEFYFCRLENDSKFLTETEINDCFLVHVYLSTSTKSAVFLLSSWNPSPRPPKTHRHKDCHRKK